MESLISSRNIALSCLLLLTAFSFSANAADQVTSGEMVSFQGACENCLYSWTAEINGMTFAQGSNRVFAFQAPNVSTEEEMKTITVRMLVKSAKGGCTSQKISSITVLAVPTSGISGISIDKGCIFSSPVLPGDRVTYTYNVSNIGDLSLKDINVKDSHDWGPGCNPAYVGGDNGNLLLDPGESWRYEAAFIVPDPDLYIKLSTMGAEPTPAATIRKMEKLRIRMTIMMNKLKELRARFNLSAADLSLKTERNVTYYNYTSRNGEMLVLQREGDETQLTEYSEPVSGGLLTTKIGPKDKIIFDSYLSRETREFLKMEYDLPAKGFINCTVKDLNNGDIAVMVIDPLGNIISREFRMTPPNLPALAKVWLNNIATVTAVDPAGKTLSDQDAFSLEIHRPLPDLFISKNDDRDPVPPGELLNYTISYGNRGGSNANAVVIKDTYDKNVTFVSSNPLPDPGTDNLWTIGGLDKSREGLIEVTVRVKSSVANGTLLINMANMTCRENAIAGAVAETLVNGLLPVLEINKTASIELISPGEYINYTISFKNTGGGNATNVTVTDIIDKNLTFIGSTPWPSTITPEIDGTVRLWWNASTLSSWLFEPGDAGSINISAGLPPDPKHPNINKVYNLFKIDSKETAGVFKSISTFVVHSIFVHKKADKATYAPGENVTYTILYGNVLAVDANDTVLNDTLPDVEYLGASPAPDLTDGRILTWYLGLLHSKENGTIYVFVRIKDRAGIKFEETQSVSGQGYISTRQRMSTAREPFGLINYVNITANITEGSTTKIISDASSASIGIRGARGTEVDSTEHGSGYYEEEAQIIFNTTNNSIKLDKQIFAKHQPSVFSLPGNRSLNYDSLWFDRTNAINRIRDEKLTENYLYMDLIDKQSSFFLDENQTVYSSVGEFYGGMARIGYIEHLPGSTKVSKEFLEDYHGSFKVGQHLDSYGSGVTYSKSASGQGYASSDKSIKNKQSSYEHGSGYYQSEETVRTGTIHKEINVSYVPNNQTAGSVGINYNGKWSEGMAAEDSKMRSLIRERLSSADYLSRESLMDSASLSMTGEFLGSQSLQTVVKGTGKNNESARVEETFVGSYRLDTAISIHKPSKYLYPHLNVTKRAFKEDEETVLYRIAVTNDGNKTLANVCIEDVLPQELTFINSSLRPQVDGRKVSWSILSLPIGSHKTIDLRVRLNDTYIMIANRVNATASYGDKTVTAYGQCSMIMDRMPCRLERIEAHKVNITLNESRYFESGSWKPPECMGLTANCSDCNSYIDEYYDSLNSTCSCP